MLGLVSGLWLVLVTSLCDMCTKTTDVNFGATILTLTLGEWRMDSGLESGVGQRQYCVFVFFNSVFFFIFYGSSWSVSNK